MGLIDALQAEGMEVVVITPIDDFINHIYKADVKYVPIYKLTRKSKNPLQDFKLYSEFVSIYKKVKPDLVIQYTIKPNIYGGMAANRLGIKIISVIPGLGYAFVGQSWLRKISEFLYKRSLKYSSSVVFENQDDCHLFVQNKIIQDKQAVTFKGCGVDISHFQPMPTNGRMKGVVFLYMGRLILEKGIREFVEAARMISKTNKEAHFNIIGHIDEENPSAVPKEEFLNWIEHPQISYLGFKHDVRQVIADSDCIVLPSYYPEGIPRVLQEAMAMEKAIITTNTNGCREAVDHGENGWLVEPRSTQDLFEKFTMAIASGQDQLDDMGKKGRQKAIQEFDEKISIGLYVQLVAEALA